MNCLDSIKALSVYPDVYALLSDVYPECVGPLDEDRLTWLQHFGDFDGFMYALINEAAVLVLDDFNGDVIARYDNIDSFVNSVEEAMQDEFD